MSGYGAPKGAGESGVREVGAGPAAKIAEYSSLGAPCQ